MDERERVIYDLARCTCHVPDACRDCSKYRSGDVIECMESLMMDALKLLKEQEPVKPIRLENWWKCPSCNGNIVANMKYCPNCGRTVKWDE